MMNHGGTGGYRLEVKELVVQVEHAPVLQGVNLAVGPGSVHALVGPNGSGKTSLLMAIMGYPAYRIISGSITLDGVDVTSWGITERAKRGIALAHQRPPTLRGVTWERLLQCVHPAAARQDPRRERALREFRLAPLLARDVNAGLSGGEIKRSELGQLLLLSQPRLALIDEPDSGVDVETLPLMGRMINALLTSGAGADAPSALIITHSCQILDYVAADRAHVMVDGVVRCSEAPGRVVGAIRKRGYHGCRMAGSDRAEAAS